MMAFLSHLFSSGSARSIRVPPVKVRDVEKAVEKAERSLKHLLKLNHANHSLLISTATPELSRSHNNVAHLLISAFLFGANEVDLSHLYEVESRYLEPWKDSPGEVVGDDWKEYLGKKEYQRAFLDFFEDQLVEESYDWRSVLHKFLFAIDEPLISSITASLGQPLVHLAYALETSSRDVAMEALTIVATCYHENDIHKYSDDSSYFQAEPSYRSTSIIEILNKVHTDSRFNSDSLAVPAEQNLEIIFRDHEAALLDHCNAWTISSDPLADFRESQAAVAALFIGTETERKYDLHLLSPLTMSYALRVILPYVPDKTHLVLVRQWWLMTLAIYIAQLRPEIKLDRIAAYDSCGKDWDWVGNQALRGTHATDVRFVKALHALREIGQTWKDSDDHYLKAAIKFASEFDGWNEINVVDPQTKLQI